MPTGDTAGVGHPQPPASVLQGGTFKARRPQWLAIILAIVGANASYIALVSAGILILSPEDPAGLPGFWSGAAIAGYACIGIPLYLGLGIVVGLLVACIAKRKSLPQRTALLLSFLVSAASGASRRCARRYRPP